MLLRGSTIIPGTGLATAWWTRALGTAVVLIACLALWAAPAHAHGGNKRPPPPPPEDDNKPPKPPPPLPPPDPVTETPDFQPPGGPDTTPRLPGDDGTGPTTPRGGRRPTTGTPPAGGGTSGRRARPSAGPTDQGWNTWWTYNRYAFLPDRADIARRQARVVTGKRVDAALVDQAARREVARHTVIPLLLRMLHPKTRVPDEVRASALIALAKLSNDSPTITLAFTYARDKHASSMVRESAALALGLMRRTDPALRAAATELDRVRSQLFSLYDDDTTPWRTQVFAMLAIGLLGDQPFGPGVHTDGMMVSRGLWSRAERERGNREQTVGLFTAIGMQPLAGIPTHVRDELRGIAMGRRVFKRRWSGVERSHALTAVVRLGAPGWSTWLMRTLASRATPREVQRAACIALGAHAPLLTHAERRAVLQIWQRAEARARDPMTQGLLQLAQGQLLAADFAEGRADLLTLCPAARNLLNNAEREQVSVRGFSMIGLALATLQADAGNEELKRYAVRAKHVLREQFRKQRGDAQAQGATAVAMGLIGTTDKVASALAQRVEDSGTEPTLRGYCSIAVAQAAPTFPKLRESLVKALWDRRGGNVRSEAALALSFLQRRDESKTLVRELERSGVSQWVLGQVAGALGRLGDLRVVPDIAKVATNKRLSDHARGIAVASLALITDPELRPSLLRLTLHSNYPARTNALHEAFTIL